MKDTRRLIEKFLGLVGFEPTPPCVGNTDSKSTELQAQMFKIINSEVKNRILDDLSFVFKVLH